MILKFFQLPREVEYCWQLFAIKLLTEFAALFSSLSTIANNYSFLEISDLLGSEGLGQAKVKVVHGKFVHKK